MLHIVMTAFYEQIQLYMWFYMGEGGGRGGGGKAFCNLGGQSRDMLPFTKKFKTKFSEA